VTRDAVPVEGAILATVPFLVVGIGVSPFLLLVRGGDPMATFLVHLGGLVGLGLVAAVRLASLAGGNWFSARGWSPRVRLAASGIAVVFLVTGLLGLVTLASAAALRYPPSLQFLQLLSALDIAWVTTALLLGVDRAVGRRMAVPAAVVLGAACVWSIERYLAVVGLGPDGGWLVDGRALERIVIPADTVAALLAVAAFAWGTVAAARRTPDGARRRSPGGVSGLRRWRRRGPSRRARR